MTDVPMVIAICDSRIFFPRVKIKFNIQLRTKKCDNYYKIYNYKFEFRRTCIFIWNILQATHVFNIIIFCENIFLGNFLYFSSFCASTKEYFNVFSAFF